MFFLKHISILRQLRLEALQRRIVGDRWDSLVNLNNNKKLAKEKIQETIQQKYQNLLMEQREVESNEDLLL